MLFRSSAQVLLVAREHYLQKAKHRREKQVSVSVREAYDLLGVLEATFPCGVEKAHQMPAAHIAHLVNSVIPKHRHLNQQIRVSRFICQLDPNTASAIATIKIKRLIVSRHLD